MSKQPQQSQQASQQIDAGTKLFYEKQIETLNTRLDDLQKRLDASLENNNQLESKLSKLTADQVNRLN